MQTTAPATVRPDLDSAIDVAIQRAVEKAARTHTVIDRHIARFIAERLEAGPGSALEHFARHDELRLDEAIEELAELRRPDFPEAWTMSLWCQLEAADEEGAR
jgi:hypothetical protein